jgi:hypothetical protein
MGRNENTNHDPEDKRTSGRARAKRGRSGYGMESIRPHLRAQLAQHELLRPTFPPPEDGTKSNESDR